MTRCANVFVYLGPAAQTQLLIRYSRSENEASGLQAFRLLLHLRVVS